MRSRARKRGEDFTLPLPEFATWFQAQPRNCSYCGIDEASLAALGIRNQTGAAVERLGVDRLVGDDGYVVGNMALACFVCNRTKSNWYTPDEMGILGEGIAAVWDVRLGRAASVTAPACRVPGARRRSSGGRCTQDTCRSCAEPFEPHTPHTPLCTVCVRFRGLRGNARRVRRDGTNPHLVWDLKGFAAWFAKQPRHCAYCEVDEETLPLLSLPTQVGLPLQRLGVDRLDSAQGYEDGNAVLCCLACNRIRSATFTPEEMHLIAPAVKRLWSRRLGHDVGTADLNA